MSGLVVFARDLGNEANRALQNLYPNYTTYRFSEDSLTPLNTP